MRKKSFFIKLINMLCICVILFVYQESAEKRQDKIAAMEQVANQTAAVSEDGSVQTDSLYADGTYMGSAQGFGGVIEVELVIEGGVIVTAEAVNADNETPDYFRQAEAIFQEVIKKQSAEVDVVTGATYSSNGIINGIKEALAKAEK